MKPTEYDVIVVGSGMVGMTFALALANETSLSIGILESQPDTIQWRADSYHHRVSAIALSSQRIFQALNAWQAMADKRVSPFTKMDVWDAQSSGNIHFDSHEVAEPALGFIVENNVIQNVLHDKIQQCSQINVISPVKLVSFQEHDHGVELTSDDGRVFRSALAVAADGAASWLRQVSGIEVDAVDYQQLAMVATVITELPHQRVARQCFRDTGPLAFLPLTDAHQCSIVWSQSLAKTADGMAMDDIEFAGLLAEAFEHRLGKVTHVGPRYTFPLRYQTAKQYVTSRVALMGDAAHVIHPLAGQGVNLGLLDAASLAEVLADAVHHQRNFSSMITLRRYERWRKADNMPMLVGVDAIKSLFASDKQSVHALRSAGLMLVNQFKVIKSMFMRHALGNRLGLPALCHPER